MDHAGLLSLLPAAVTIAVALLSHRVALALLCGVLAGALASAPSLAALGTASEILRAAFTDGERLRISAFLLFMGGLIELLSASGAYHAFARAVSRWLSTPRRARLATWGLSLTVFFDDYANVLLVGASMRGVMRRHRLSPALLAYFVDQVATVVSVMLVSTWAAFEGSLLASSAASVGLERSATALLLGSLPFHVSTWLGILLAGLVALQGRWFGRLLDSPPSPISPTSAPPAVHGHLRHVLLPLGALVAASLGGLAAFAMSKANRHEGPLSVIDLLDGAPTAWILLGATLAALTLAAGLIHRDRTLAPRAQWSAFGTGLRQMIPASLVIVLSKGLADVSEVLGTGRYLSGLAAPLLETVPGALPAVVFLVAVLLTVATGFSWSSMAILLPVAFQMATADPAGIEALAPVLSGAVIAGSITGGLMVPWSDTSVMTAAAFGITPVYHAKTQALQVLPVTLASLVVLGFLGRGVSWPLAWLTGAGLLVGAHLLFARPSREAEPSEGA
jgi:Na+/H+ antiporter NhaC